MFRFMWKLHNKRKSACKMFRQITFFKASQVSKQWAGIFKVSNVFWNNKMEEKAGVKKQIFKKGLGLEENEHTCSVEGIFLVSDSTAPPYWKLVCPIRTNQSLSKLLQFWKWQAKIPDTPLGLTGIAKLHYQANLQVETRQCLTSLLLSFVWLACDCLPFSTLACRQHTYCRAPSM